MHIFDPVSCEKVTHIVPQPLPVDIRTYAESGCKFFVVEEKIEGRLDGGEFGNVKSVSQMDAHGGVTTEPEFDSTKPKMCTTCEVRLCDYMSVNPPENVSSAKGFTAFALVITSSAMSVSGRLNKAPRRILI